MKTVAAYVFGFLVLWACAGFSPHTFMVGLSSFLLAVVIGGIGHLIAHFRKPAQTVEAPPAPQPAPVDVYAAARTAEYEIVRDQPKAKPVDPMDAIKRTASRMRRNTHTPA